MQGNRGMMTEMLINVTNEHYRRKGLALVTKIPTPIKVVKQRGGIVTHGFFEEKGVLDYLGIVQGLPVTFDAKETKEKRLPLKNIAEHQYEYIEDFIKQGGYAFIIAHFAQCGAFYLIPGEFILECRKRALEGGMKSIGITELPDKYKINSDNLIEYLPQLNEYYRERNPKH